MSSETAQMMKAPKLEAAKPRTTTTKGHARVKQPPGAVPKKKAPVHRGGGGASSATAAAALSKWRASVAEANMKHKTTGACPRKGTPCHRTARRLFDMKK